MYRANLQEGRVLWKLERFEEAVPKLKRAVDIVDAWQAAVPPEAMVFASYWLGEGYAAVGDDAAALISFETAAANLAAGCERGDLPLSLRDTVGARLAERIEDLRGPVS